MAASIRDWGIALAFAVTLHLGVVSLITGEAPGVGALDSGIGGMEIGLGPVGGASSGSRSQSESTGDAEVQAQAEPPEVRKAVDAAEQPHLDEPAEFSVTDTRLASPQPIENVPVETVEPVEPEPDHGVVVEHAAEFGPVEDSSGVAPVEESGAADTDLAGSGADVVSGSGDGTSGGGASGFALSYIATLQNWLEKHKTYPFRAKSKRQQGVVLLYFVIDRAGRVLDHRIEESSKYRLLDEEAIEILERAQPFPPFSEDVKDERLEVIVPIQFSLS